MPSSRRRERGRAAARRVPSLSSRMRPVVCAQAARLFSTMSSRRRGETPKTVALRIETGAKSGAGEREQPLLRAHLRLGVGGQRPQRAPTRRARRRCRRRRTSSRRRRRRSGGRRPPARRAPGDSVPSALMSCVSRGIEARRAGRSRAPPGGRSRRSPRGRPGRTSRTSPMRPTTPRARRRSRSRGRGRCRGRRRRARRRRGAARAPTPM